LTSSTKHPIPFTVKLCSDKAAFEVRANRKVSLNMGEVEKRLRSSKLHRIVLCTPHMIFLRSGTAETTLSKDGRLLIKKVQNEAEAKHLAQEILQVILE
jgi:ArsR family metal-binding transcriptional regulator